MLEITSFSMRANNKTSRALNKRQETIVYCIVLYAIEISFLLFARLAHIHYITSFNT